MRRYNNSHFNVKHDYFKCFFFLSTTIECIRSNLRVAQNARFIMEPVYLGSGTMIPIRGETLNFRLSESRKINSPELFALPNFHWKIEFCIVFARAFSKISTRRTFHGLKITNCIDS